MELSDIAKEIKDAEKRIFLIYAFNATGKTRLSVEYKETARAPQTGFQTGVYYNAFSEDLFIWDN
ncbi:MAG: anticodon nuclease, partial [Prevotella pallens]|nr:anticodon nuclease [Prevotella pallens]